jgi:folate-dependent phosphoribosylglycinamide formyltransferase PurN
VHAIERAWDAYQRGELDQTGVMVHLVPDEGVDDGPVVVQAIVPIHDDDTLENLEARIHTTEYRLLVTALHTLIC